MPAVGACGTRGGSEVVGIDDDLASADWFPSAPLQQASPHQHVALLKQQKQPVSTGWVSVIVLSWLCGRRAAWWPRIIIIMAA